MRLRTALLQFLIKISGNKYILLDKEEYTRQQEYYTKKLAEYEKLIASLQIDQTEYQFLRHFAATLIQLEKLLHNSDNADEILQATFRTACEFYDADWAGFLELDMDAGVWWPFDWYSAKNNDMTKTYLAEFEPVEIVPRWINAMKENQAIVVTDREHIKEEHPEEYALYQRVKLYSVMAVPVTPRPCGFLAIRNPKRYVDPIYVDMLQMLAFVALTNINDKMTQRMQKMIKVPRDIQDANDIYVRLLGEFALITDNGTLTAEDCEWSSTPAFLSYLAIRQNKIHQAYELDGVFFKEHNGSLRNVYNMVSHARTDLQPLNKANLVPSAKTEGYKLSGEYHITTDLIRFDRLYDEIMNSGSSYRTYMNCVQIFDMYDTDIQLDVRDDIVRYLTEEYRTKYFSVLEKLLGILQESGDYEGIRKVAEKGMLIEPDKPEMYYWLIAAYDKMNMPHTAREYLRTAQNRLSKGEYQQLTKLLDVKQIYVDVR